MYKAQITNYKLKSFIYNLVKKVTFIFFLFVISCTQNTKPGTHKSPSFIDSDTSTIKNFKFKNKDFEAFYQQFITDTAFQINRVKFPLRGKYSDYEGNEDWEKETWPYIKWDLHKEVAQTNDSISIRQDDNKFFFGEYCLDCGFSFEMQFEKLNDKWFLTYRQENNF